MIDSCLPFAVGRHGKRDAMSPKYHYWVKFSIARQNCRMIILRCLCICEERNLFTILHYSIQGYLGGIVRS